MLTGTDVVAERTAFRMKEILTQSDLDRVKMKKEDDGFDLYVDLHQMKAVEAKRLAKNLIALIMEPCRIFFIHGYNHGTVLKQMIANDINSSKISQKTVLKDNPGVTSVALYDHCA